MIIIIVCVSNTLKLPVTSQQRNKTETLILVETVFKVGILTSQ